MYLRPKVIAALTAGLSVCASQPSVASSGLFPQMRNMFLASVHVYKPNAPVQIGGGAHAFGPGSSYVQPLLVNDYATANGDSITENGGGNSWAGNAVITTANYSNGYSGWLFPLSGNRILASDDWNYGVGASTTASAAGRFLLAGNDCNSAQTWSSLCFTGVHTTALAGSSGTSLKVASTTGVAAGDYVSIFNDVAYDTTVVSVNSGTSVTLSKALTAVPAANYDVVFSHPSLSSAYVSFLGGLNPSLTDVDLSKSNIGTYSPRDNPAVKVFFAYGTNDKGADTLQSMKNMAYVLDGYGPKGSNKIVIAADMFPRGLAEGYSVPNADYNGSPEFGTFTGGTYTLSQGATYYDMQQVFYAPSGTGAAPFVAGVNDGGVLINCSTLTPAAPAGTPTCTPAAGQYSVSSVGVITVNAADAGKKIAMFYRWVYTSNSIGPGPNYITVLHDWWNSTSCGSFTPTTGYSGGAPTYPIDGAQCNRPWVHVAQTWAANLDPTTGNNFYPKPYATVDDLHPGPYGGANLARAMVDMAMSIPGAVSPTPVFTLPTVSNPFIYGTIYNSGTLTPPAACPAATYPNAGNKAYWMYSPVPAVSSGVYSAETQMYFYHSQFATYRPKVVCVDPSTTLSANGAILMDTPSPATFPIVGSLTVPTLLQNDKSSRPSMLMNGVIGILDATQMNATALLANTGTPSLGTAVTRAHPAGWSFTVDYAAALAAGTMGLSYGIETNPLSDGNSDFVIVMQGYSPTSSARTTLAQNTITSLASTIAGGTTPWNGDMHRGICEVRVSKGPNGHLTGLQALAVQVTDTSSVPVVPPGLQAGAYGGWIGSQGSGATVFTDASVEPGAPNVQTTALGNELVLEELSPPARVISNGSVSQSLSVLISTKANDPVSATIRIRKCGLMKVDR